ncbi:GNAT family N-acetyltransferase [Streptomyces polygonati]|uniref:GNAT family N-acetyltransferase n=1 Tax=Streptomyces polygonati TaxID=1617087 RepID=A0ABV8HZK5_9ACTN
MIRGEKVGLRARQESDLTVLHTELYEDVATYCRSDTRAWRPIPAGTPYSPFALKEPTEQAAPFSVVELASGELAGESVLWGIDVHNRTAHVGLALRPAFRGRGLGTDVVRTMCVYGFAIRGLRRLQLETLADNAAMIASAEAVGFRHEGTLRRSSWVYGQELDEVVFGLLHDEWAPPAKASD